MYQRKNQRYKSYTEIAKRNISPPNTLKNHTNFVTEQQKHIFHRQKKNINQNKNTTIVRINNNRCTLHNNISDNSKNNTPNICNNTK